VAGGGPAGGAMGLAPGPTVGALRVTGLRPAGVAVG